MKKVIVIFVIIIAQGLMAQTIKCSFPQAKNTEIVLKSFEGLEEKELSKTTADSLGNFTLKYPENYVGASLLQIQNKSSIIVILNHENFTMKWDDFKDFSSLEFKDSPENDAFAKGIIINQEAEKKLAGLRYLLPLYKDQAQNTAWLQEEIKKQEKSFDNYIGSLPENSYIRKYLRLRKFLGDMQLTNERYNEINRVAEHEMYFKKLDFASDALWYSGLIKEILNGLYQTIELYKDESKITTHSIEANDAWLKALEKYPAKLQVVAEYCFTMLEKKSLTKASEQIALAVLNKKSCQLTEKQTNLFEQYRKLAIGKTAPNIYNLKNKGVVKNLKELKNQYKFVVFGASWCPNCQNDYPSLIGKYKKLKEIYDIEFVYISIDTDKTAFENYYKDAPFNTFCDTKGWETQAAKEYHVFATPTYILLDKDLKILAKPSSPEFLEEWFADKNKK